MSNKDIDNNILDVNSIDNIKSILINLIDNDLCINDDNLISIPKFEYLIDYIGTRYRVNTDKIEQITDRFEVYKWLCCKFNMTPFMNDFAMFCGIDRSTFWNWESGNRREFSSAHVDTVKKIKSYCESSLVREANYAKNPAGPIFLLKNNHGYQDKTEIEVTSNQQMERSVEDIANDYVEDKKKEDKKLPLMDF